MKIAIFHNFMDNIGGAEYVTLLLARELDADVYTTNINADKIQKMGFSADRIFSIGSVPINAPLKQELAYYRFRFLNLKNAYDYYIIAGDWAMGAAVHNKPHLWYVHSPTREIWDLYEYVRSETVPKYLRWIFDGWVAYRRFLNKRDVSYVQKIVCNSKNVQERVKKYLGRDSDIIHPPTETSRYQQKPAGDYWLSVNRLISHKRIELQIEAFRQLPDEKLIIVGSYEQSRHFKSYAEYIQRIKPDNVEIISWVDAQNLIDLYAYCKGFIATAQDEDFGMGPVEAMASGKPVIAPNEGGFKETVIDGVTGKSIDGMTTETLASAICEIGAHSENYSEACLTRAQEFDVGVFVEKIKSMIGELAN